MRIFFNALGRATTTTTNANNTEAAASQCSSLNSDEMDFKSLLLRRKNEESKLNPKCKVVIKDRVTVGETKTDSLNESKVLLQKISDMLSKEEYQKFKVALSNFHAGKKANDNEKKIKYYKILRSLFSKDLEFFKEIEKFIQFNGVIKEKLNVNSNSSNIIEVAAPTKRKFDDL